MQEDKGGFAKVKFCCRRCLTVIHFITISGHVHHYMAVMILVEHCKLADIVANIVNAFCKVLTRQLNVNMQRHLGIVVMLQYNNFIILLSLCNYPPIPAQVCMFASVYIIINFLQ